MVYSAFRSLLGLVLAAVLCGGTALAQSEIGANAAQDLQSPTLVTLRWGARAGVSKYRLQLAGDPDFSDILFDRVVAGHEYRLNDLPPGRYFWRVASLNARLGEFSSAGVIDVAATPITKPPSPIPTPGPRTSVRPPRGVWYAAIGDVTKSIVAHLRSPGISEIVAVTTDGRVVALDAQRGIALWTFRPRSRNQRATSQINVEPVTIRSASGVENVAVFFGNVAILIEGSTGRELSRITLPAPAVNAVASGTKIFVIDSSLRKLFLIDAPAGKLISETVLPQRAVGSPLPVNFAKAPTVMIALEDGGLQVVDGSGKAIASSNAGSPATTAPLVVRTNRGDLVLVGTRSGLTAMTADELRPLGRITLNDDTPRGTLRAEDLDGDGRDEVVMFTNRGKVVVIKSDEGKIVWQADARRAQSTFFRDLNSDGTLDLLMAGPGGQAFALSGRDGAVVWQDEANTATNHVAGGAPSREMLTVSSRAGVLLIAPDANRSGLRAIEFPKQ